MRQPPFRPTRYRIPVQLDFWTVELNTHYQRFAMNCDQFSEEEVKQFFIEVHLPQLICLCSNLNLNINYKKPLVSKDLSVYILLRNIYTIISYFNINIEIDYASRGYSLIAAWLIEAVDWIEDIIKPFVSFLKYHLPLFEIGTQYFLCIIKYNKIVKLTCEASDTSTINQYIDQLSQLKEQITVFEQKMHKTISSALNCKRNYFKENGRSSNLAQVKYHITSVEYQLLDFLSASIISQNNNGISYCIDLMPTISSKSHCRFETLTFGLLFLAQKELSSTPANRQVFKEIATLIPEITTDKLEEFVESLTFPATHSKSFSRVAVSSHNLSVSIVSNITQKLRRLLAHHKISKLTMDLKNDTTDVMNYIWPDILNIFWHRYDIRIMHEKSYFFHDNIISQNISKCVTHMNRHEEKSAAKFIAKSKQTDTLSSKGLWTAIALVIAKHEEHDHGEVVNHIHYQMETASYIFFDLSLFDFENLFIHYYYSYALCTSDNIFQKYKKSLFSNIHAAATHAQDPSIPIAQINFIVSHEKHLTAEGLNLLRAHLLDDARFSHNPNIGNEKNSPKSQKQQAKLSSSESQPVLNKVIKRGAALEMTTVNSHHSNYGACQPVNKFTINSEFEFDNKAIDLFQPSQEDIRILCEHYLNIRVIFHKPNGFLQRHTIDKKIPVLHFTIKDQDQGKMLLHIDPFPNFSAPNSYLIAKFSYHMTSTQLSKQEIIDTLNEVIPLKIRTIALTIFSTLEPYIELAINIVQKCRENTSVIADIMQFIVANKVIIDKSTEDFKQRVDYLFYRYYGKNFNQIAKKGLDELEISAVKPIIDLAQQRKTELR